MLGYLDWTWEMFRNTCILWHLLPNTPPFWAKFAMKPELYPILEYKQQIDQFLSLFTNLDLLTDI